MKDDSGWTSDTNSYFHYLSTRDSFQTHKIRIVIFKFVLFYTKILYQYLFKTGCVDSFYLNALHLPSYNLNLTRQSIYIVSASIR